MSCHKKQKETIITYNGEVNNALAINLSYPTQLDKFGRLQHLAAKLHNYVYIYILHCFLMRNVSEHVCVVCSDIFIYSGIVDWLHLPPLHCAPMYFCICYNLPEKANIFVL